MSHDGGTSPFVVGMVTVTCPACAEGVPVDVKVQSISTVNGSFFRVVFQDESPNHACVGRRS